MALDATKAKKLLDGMTDKAKDFLESDHVTAFSQEAEKVVRQGINKAKELDLKDMAEKGKRVIQQGKDFVENLDPKKISQDAQQFVSDVKANPDKALNRWIESVVRFLAKAVWLPDPKTGKKPDDAKGDSTGSS